MLGCSCTTTGGSSPEASAARSPDPSFAVEEPAPASPRSLPSFCEAPPGSAPVADGATAQLVKDGFVFVEGPVWSDAQQAFYFSEMDFEHEGQSGPPAKIHRLQLPDSLSVFVEESGSNGLALDGDELVACTHDTQSLSRYSLKDGSRSSFVSDFSGKHFNSPNDATVHSAGYVYFTDPDWQLAGRQSETGITGVYARSPNGEVTLIEGGLPKPNGISLSPDETRLYVGSVDGVISVFPVQADGSVGPRAEFAKVDQPDGMGVDCAGNLYVASHAAGQVIVLSPEGKQIAQVQVAPRTTNVAFGGPDHRTLLITAGSGIYSLRAEIPGFPY